MKHSGSHAFFRFLITVMTQNNLKITYIELELHLTGLGAVHLSFLEDLIVLRICSLADILDAPGEA